MLHAARAFTLGTPASDPVPSQAIALAMLTSRNTHSSQDTEDPRSSVDERGTHSSLEETGGVQKDTREDDCSGGVQKDTREDDSSGGVQKDTHIGDKKDTHIGGKIQRLSESLQELIDADTRKGECKDASPT